MTTHQLLTDARQRLTVTRLGKSMWRETDADLIVIRRLIEALEAVTAERDEANHAAARHKSDAALFEAERDRLKAAIETARIDFADELTRKGVHTFNIHDIRKYAALNEGKN